jgi:hypothetical protein
MHKIHIILYMQGLFQGGPGGALAPPPWKLAFPIFNMGLPPLEFCCYVFAPSWAKSWNKPWMLWGTQNTGLPRPQARFPCLNLFTVQHTNIKKPGIGSGNDVRIAMTLCVIKFFTVILTIENSVPNRKNSSRSLLGQKIWRLVLWMESALNRRKVSGVGKN